MRPATNRFDPTEAVGPCCGTCALRSVDRTARGHFECLALDVNGAPRRLPVLPSTGTACGYWRRRASHPGEER
jgi:hypothetical protein